MKNRQQGEENHCYRSDEEKYQFLLANSGDIMWTMDMDFRWRFFTINVERVTHYKTSDLIGKTVWEFVDPAYHGLLKDMLKRRLRGEDLPAYEVMVIDADGRRIPFEVKTTPILDRKNKIIGIQGISRDITERWRREAAIRKSEEKFRDLVENVSDWVWEADKNLMFTYSSPRVEDYLGYTPEQVVGRPIFDFMEPEMVKRIRRTVGNMKKQRKKVVVAEKRMISKNGEPVDFEMTLNLRLTEDGALAGYRGICRDIRDRKRAEEARRKAYEELEKRVEERTRELLQAQATLRSVLETAPIGILVVEAETLRVTYHSPGVERIFGKPLRGNTHGLKLYPYRILRPNGSPLTENELPIRISLSRGVSVSNTEVKLIVEDGEERNLLMSSAPIHDRDGRMTGAVAAIIDITRLKATEKDLREAKAQAEMYLELMSHDINNLNQAGIGYLELAQDALISGGKLEDNDRILLSKVMDALSTSSQLIDNVRKLQQSRAGGMKYQAIDLCEILTELKEYYSHSPDRNVTIGLDMNDRCLVIANELIRDVFSNLISNSIKHSSPDKPLKINIIITNAGVNGRPYYDVAVEDNGPGIPDDLKGRLFTRFERGKTKASGRGLGLYLVKTLVEEYKGSVHVEDRVAGDYHKGSRFVVRLPVAPASAGVHRRL